MQEESLSLDELARQLGRDRRELEKLANRGRIPGRKRDGVWQFHGREITQWLEQEMRDFSDSQLRDVEQSTHSGAKFEDLPVSHLIRPETIEFPITGKSKRSVLEHLIEAAGRTYEVWEPARVLAAVMEREDDLSTGFAGGIAFPHPRNPMPETLGDSIVAFGYAPGGIPFGSPDGQLTDLFFLILCRDSRTHLRVLARLGRMANDSEFLHALRMAEDSTEVFQIIEQADAAIAAKK
ncbi:PTS sugar transporter subunit IIA [Stratiformator vulcanicus]|uniref:PTS sugar transporter subunit IIA n=1 Tax=Stratiformator vulcanicus TaxID=2527980 RepID=UPI0028780558|nr:PTS sugar transporter subunit IIA [Stratiformator vulcanicus]